MTNYYCRLCFLNINPEEAQLFSKLITEMIQCCIPEMDFKLVHNPVICPQCNDELERSFKFKKKCLEVQENIKLIMVNKGENDSGCFNIFDIKEEFIPASREMEAEENMVMANGIDNELNNSHISSSSEDLLLPIITKIEHSSESFSPEPNIKHKYSHKPSLVKNLVDVRFSRRFCHNCRKSFTTLNELIEHLYVEHHNEEELYKCLLCRFKSISLPGMKMHYKKFHPNCDDLNASCFFCRTDTKNCEELFSHMKTKHSSVCKSRYYCNSCDYKSRSLVNFRKHFFLSHDFTCNYCLVKCSTTSLLNRHLLKHNKKL